MLDILVVNAGLTNKMDFTVTSLLHDVDLFFGDQFSLANQSFDLLEVVFKY